MRTGRPRSPERICAKCKKKPKHINANGNEQAYCLECGREKNREYMRSRFGYKNPHYEAKQMGLCLRCRINPNGDTLRPYLCQECSKESRREWKRVTNYGEAAEKIFEKLVELQDGKCAICKRAPEVAHHKTKVERQDLFIDHDHATGEIRGLLCRGCNWGLGHFQDSSYILREAVQYLENVPAQLLS